MRMAIKLMIARQRQSRDVKKRTAFILHFSKHATKKTSHVNQERSWGLSGSFFEVQGNTGEKGGSLVSSQRCC